MPEAAASDGLSATARVAFPMRVRCSQTATPMSTTKLVAMLQSETAVSEMAPNCSLSSAEPGSDAVLPPMKNWKT